MRVTEGREMTSKHQPVDTFRVAPIVTPHTSCLVGHKVNSPIRLYSIEFKDAETADTVIFTADDWTEDEKRLALALIGRLNRLDAARRSQVSADVEARQGRARYH
jgi:hypothetical protein